MRTNRFLAWKLLITLNLIVLMEAEEMLAQSYSDHPLVHTYSIVAYDSITGNMGVAVQSHWFSVWWLPNHLSIRPMGPMV